MTFVIADRVKETSTSTSTGDFALAGAMTGFKTFASRCSVGDTVYYAIQGVDGTGVPTAEWECGLGTYSASNTLTRTTVTASSNADAAVSFSAGTKQVYITMPAVQVAWARERLTANRTYYVRTDGSDSNTGLANTAGGAFLTLTKFAAVVKTLDVAGFTVTAQLADGTYTAGGYFSEGIPGCGLGNPITIQGNSGTPANVVVSVTSGQCFESYCGASIYVKDLKMQTTTGGVCLQTAYGGLTRYGNVNFGACAAIHINTTHNGKTYCTAAYTISGGAVAHHHGDQGGVNLISAATITLTGTPAFSAYFAGVSAAGSIKYSTVVFSGSATGPRFFTHKCGCIDVSASVGTSLTFLPGDSAGTAVTGTYGAYAY